MTDNKRYYWLKLKEDFFDEDTIAWIEEQDKGKEYCLFYLKLCLKSLKTEGILIRNVGKMLIPYDVKQLGKITNTDVDTVRVAMELFKNIGLVEILENGEIKLNQLKNMVGSETKKAQLMRNKRKKDKEKQLLESGNNVTTQLPNCYSSVENCYTEQETEQEQEKDTEIEQEIDLDKEKEKELEQQQDIKKEDVVGKVSLYMSHLNKKDINTIADEFLKTNKDMYYLTEKLILVTDTKNVENEVGYLIKAIKDDYKLRLVTSAEKLLMVWQQELIEKPNNPIAIDKVNFFKYLSSKNN